MIPVFWIVPALFVAGMAYDRSLAPKEGRTRPEDPRVPTAPKAGPQASDVQWKALTDSRGLPGGSQARARPERFGSREPVRPRAKRVRQKKRVDDFDLGGLRLGPIPTSASGLDEDWDGVPSKFEAGTLGNVLALTLPEAVEAGRLQFLKGPVRSVTQGDGEILVRVDPDSTAFLALPPAYLGWSVRIVER